jgi:hypothetical protein
MREYREQQRGTKNPGTSPARRALAPVTSRAGMVALLLACGVGATGCGTEPSLSDVERHPNNYRCLLTQSDGTCLSIPVNCPEILPTIVAGDRVNCPAPGEIIPIEDDHCPDKRICID